MLWIALHCPRLALERALRTDPTPGAVAICDRTRVLQASDAAQAAGVRPGVRRATALSLAADLRLLEHDPEAEGDALGQVAGWMLQFTPSVALQPPDGVALEIEASLRLFGGEPAIVARVRAGLDALGFSASLGRAPTAAAARLLARWRDGARVEHVSGLGAGLGPLPVELVEAAAPHREALAAIGVRRFADLARLPRDGLARRFGPALLAQVDAALGRVAEPQRWFVAPPRFAARLELLAQVEHAEAMAFGARRLVVQLAGWLGARQAAARDWTLVGEHDGGRHACEDTRLELRLAAPSRDPERMLAVLRERLAALRLPAPVHTLRLECDAPVALPGGAGELFPVPGRDAEGLERLVERLQARLGRDGVQRLALAADHRPEDASRLEPLDSPAPRVDAPLPGLPRPLWLLEAPVPLAERDRRPWWRGPLALLAGPERIETGWWDGRPVQRDYFVAESESDGWVWIFRTRGTDAEPGWYLHGIFA